MWFITQINKYCYWSLVRLWFKKKPHFEIRIVCRLHKLLFELKSKFMRCCCWIWAKKFVEWMCEYHTIKYHTFTIYLWNILLMFSNSYVSLMPWAHLECAIITLVHEFWNRKIITCTLHKSCQKYNRFQLSKCDIRF